MGGPVGPVRCQGQSSFDRKWLRRGGDDDDRDDVAAVLNAPLAVIVDAEMRLKIP